MGGLCANCGWKITSEGSPRATPVWWHIHSGLAYCYLQKAEPSWRSGTGLGGIEIHEDSTLPVGRVQLREGNEIKAVIEIGDVLSEGVTMASADEGVLSDQVIVREGHDIGEKIVPVADGEGFHVVTEPGKRLHAKRWVDSEDREHLVAMEMSLPSLQQPVDDEPTIGRSGIFLDLDPHIQALATELVHHAHRCPPDGFAVYAGPSHHRSKWTDGQGVPIWDNVMPGQRVDITEQVQSWARTLGWSG